MALATLAETKLFMGFTNANNDTLIQQLIDSATTAIKSHTDRELEDSGSDVTEFHNSDGRSVVVTLREFPVIGTITSVHDDVDRVFDSSSLIPAIDYYVDVDAGVIELIDGVFSRGAGNIQVLYRAGFVVDSIPKDLSQACIKLVAHWFNLRKQSGYASRSLKEGSVSFEFNHEIPGDVKALLAPYIRREAA